MQHENIHFIPLENRSLLFRHYAFVDTKDYLTDQLFIQEKVRVWFWREFLCPNSEYRIVCCKVRKRDKAAFLTALQKLPSKMLLFGHTDYLDFCHSFQELLRTTRKEKLYE